MTTLPENCNPEIDQDRVADLFSTYERYGYVMFPQQEKIYQEITSRIIGKTVLEAGCGNGVGSGMLEWEIYDPRLCSGRIVATDKLLTNIKFARKLYPFIEFSTWDINERWTGQPIQVEVVVAIEVFEHVANPQAAMDNLLAACTETLWLSTPNANVRKLPPDNPYHVWEYTPDEIMDFVRNSSTTAPVYVVHAYDWETFEQVSIDTKCDPLIYRIDK